MPRPGCPDGSGGVWVVAGVMVVVEVVWHAGAVLIELLGGGWQLGSTLGLMCFAGTEKIVVKLLSLVYYF